MKKTLVFILFTFLLISCQSEKITNCPEENSKRPKQAITYKEMASMFKEYDNGQKKVLDKYITSKTKGKDSVATISQFYSIEGLKQYIAYIERLSKEKDIPLTGIKIFTSAYPSDYSIKEYQNRIAFILAPTTLIDGKQIAYEPLKSAKGKPVSMMSILHKYADSTTRQVNRASFISIAQGDDDDEDSSGYNRGHVEP
jgi:hypothetical protein